jgi:hypothetical protein
MATCLAAPLKAPRMKFSKKRKGITKAVETSSKKTRSLEYCKRKRKASEGVSDVEI